MFSWLANAEVTNELFLIGNMRATVLNRPDPPTQFLDAGAIQVLVNPVNAHWFGAGSKRLRPFSIQQSWCGQKVSPGHRLQRQQQSPIFAGPHSGPPTKHDNKIRPSHDSRGV